MINNLLECRYVANLGLYVPHHACQRNAFHMDLISQTQVSDKLFKFKTLLILFIWDTCAICADENKGIQDG